MKRILALLCALVLVLLTACGSSGQAGSTPSPEPSESTQSDSTPPPSDSVDSSADPSPDPSLEPSDDPAPEYFNPLTGLPTETDLSGQRPVAIMLNNIKAAMPQQGNSQADIIYEIPVEGGITRMMGVYQDISQVGTIGAVRSARPYYVQLAFGHDAIYASAGGSQEAYSLIKSYGLSYINALVGKNSSTFWRDANRYGDKTYAYEHTLLTSGEKLLANITSHKLDTAHRDGFSYTMNFLENGTPADGESALKVTVALSKTKTTTFQYDDSTGLYKVYQYGSAYIDGNDDTQIAVTNLIILQTECKVVDKSGHVSVDLSSGKGWFACGGKMIPITWEKGKADQYLRYYTADGNPLSLGQGKSYVCIMPLNRDITVE